MENLARSAGYRDPQRLVWAMEARGDRRPRRRHRRPPGTATSPSPCSLDDAGQPELDVRRGDKALKSVPAASAKRVPEIAALKSRATALRKQASRMRASLEAAMRPRRDLHRPPSSPTYLAHPMLAPMLARPRAGQRRGRDRLRRRCRPRPAGDGDRMRSTAAGPHRAPCRPAGVRRVAGPAARLFTERRAAVQAGLPRALHRRPTPSARWSTSRAGTPATRCRAGQAGGALPATAAGSPTSRSASSRPSTPSGSPLFCSLLDGWGSPTEVEDATIQDVWFIGRDGPAGPGGRAAATVLRGDARPRPRRRRSPTRGGVDPETSESASRCAPPGRRDRADDVADATWR